MSDWDRMLGEAALGRDLVPLDRVRSESAQRSPGLVLLDQPRARPVRLASTSQEAIFRLEALEFRTRGHDAPGRVVCLGSRWIRWTYRAMLLLVLAAVASTWVIRTAESAAGLADAPAAPGLNRDQAVALLRAADAAPGPQRARTAALVAVLLFTGARLGEIIGADVGDLGTEQGHRVLRVTRGDGQRRSLALPVPAATRIDAYLSGRADLAGVQGRRGGLARRPLFTTGPGRRLFPADVWRLVHRLAARAGLPDDLAGHLGPEALRHSFAALYLDAGGSLGDLQQVMGHADPPTTQRYGRARHAPGGSPGEVVAAYLAARRR